MFTKSAQYYDLIYEARGKDYAAESAYLVQLIQKNKKSTGNALLDIACGTGNHLLYLKEEYEVEGADLDQEMLDLAKAKLPDLTFHQFDMLDFSLGRKFDVVLCLFSSIAYVKTLANMKQALKNMAEHTRSGGLVIVEPWFTPDKFNPGAPHASFVDSPEIKIARMNLEEVKEGLSMINFHYLVARQANIEYFQEQHELGLFEHGDYLSAFETAGLSVIYDEAGLEGRGLYIGLESLD
jgi:ubiquinone/menaquinone biosynthesis C-methylase UbiE